MPREPSVSWSQHGSEPSHAGAGSTIGRGSAPVSVTLCSAACMPTAHSAPQQQRPSASLTPRSSSVRRDPSSAARSTSYAPSDIDTVSAVSASEFSSGEEDAGGRTAQSATLRGRAPQQAGTGRAETGPVSVSLSRATGASTASRAGNRRASVVRDARRGSVARRNSDEDEDRFGPLDDEDDEVEHLDRGEELVRRRMKARQKEKAARRKKEKAVERERLRAQQGSVASQNVPASPGGQGPRSPTLEREGRPTYIAMPTPSSEVGPGTLSPGLSSAGGLPALSPGIYRGPTTYPSPHSHIRRPSHNQQQPQSQLGGRRMSGAQASGASTVTRAPGAGGLDVFSDAGAAPSEVPASSVAGSVVDGGDDEERDTVAGLATEAARTEAGSRLGDEVDVAHEEEEDDDDEATPSGSGGEDDVEYTLKDRQDAINIEHPFGLPIWKPALYKKSRTVTRNAESALHSTPSAAAGRHLLPGNLLWTLLFGSWLCVLCLAAALLLVVVPVGGARYGRVLWELGCYLLWPFGKYVEIDVSPTSGERGVSWVEQPHDAEVAYENAFTPVAARFPHDHAHRIPFNSRGRSGDYSDYNAAQPDGTVRASSRAAESGEASGSGSASGSGTETGAHDAAEGPGSTLSARSAQAIAQGPGETSPLKGKARAATYGATADSEEGGSSNSGGGARKEDRVSEELDVYEYVHDDQGRDVGRRGRIFGTLAFGLLFWLVVAPLMGLVCLALWGMVFTIPMAKLTWVLLKNLSSQPLALHFRSAPGNALSANHDEFGATAEEDDSDGKDFLRPLRPGQFAPRPKARRDGERQRRSKILLCTYRAMGLQYYKYTVGGVNILFVNTLPFVFFTIFDFFFVEAYVHRHHITTGFLAAISSQGALFVFALGSVLPLSYFIGMAVASISAQSSIGMGAVINATFGSIVEIILYAIALTQNKARLVEGSLVGSILAGVLLMPGLSMCSGATRRKEQRFNARSAGVTSTMLIMAIIGILTPTMFYQIYGTVSRFQCGSLLQR
jgi:Ca2+:H+ antiporter